MSLNCSYTPGGFVIRKLLNAFVESVKNLRKGNTSRMLNLLSPKFKELAIKLTKGALLLSSCCQFKLPHKNIQLFYYLYFCFLVFFVICAKIIINLTLKYINKSTFPTINNKCSLYYIYISNIKELTSSLLRHSWPPLRQGWFNRVTNHDYHHLAFSKPKLILSYLAIRKR